MGHPHRKVHLPAPEIGSLALVDIVRYTVLAYGKEESVELSGADLALAVVVTGQATVLAYLHSPRLKALVYALPLPFTAATLTLGNAPDATHICGLAALLLYIWLARFLYVHLHLPVVGAVALSALAYLVAGWLVGRSVPPGDMAFAATAAPLLCFAVLLLICLPPREEPGYRTSLPPWVKLPLTTGIVLLLLATKQVLRGFVATFPYVGVFAVYEARHSLWTLARQMPVFIVAAVPMMTLIRLTTPRLGLPGALTAGWVAFLFVLSALYHTRLVRTPRNDASEVPSKAQERKVGDDA